MKMCISFNEDVQLYSNERVSVCKTDDNWAMSDNDIGEKMFKIFYFIFVEK